MSVKNQPKISLDETELKQPNVQLFTFGWNVLKVLLVNVFGHQRDILYRKRLNFRELFIEWNEKTSSSFTNNRTIFLKNIEHSMKSQFEYKYQ